MRSSLQKCSSKQLQVVAVLLCVASVPLGLWIATEEKVDVARGNLAARTAERERGESMEPRPRPGFLEVKLVRGEDDSEKALHNRCGAELTINLDGHDEWLRAMARSSLEQSAESALAWASRLPAPARSIALGEIAVRWAEVDGFHAALLTAERLGDPNELRRAVPRVVERWARWDADAATEWVSAFPESELRSLAFAHLRWARLEIPTPPSGLPGEDFEDRSAVLEPRKTPTQYNP